MATNEPDIAAKLLEHLDAKYAAGQLSPAEHEARRTRLLADIQRGLQPAERFNHRRSLRLRNHPSRPMRWHCGSRRRRPGRWPDGHWRIRVDRHGSGTPGQEDPTQDLTRFCHVSTHQLEGLPT